MAKKKNKKKVVNRKNMKAYAKANKTRRKIVTKVRNAVYKSKPVQKARAKKGTKL